MPQLFEPLTLDNGQIIPNRLCKAAMEENLSDYGQVPGERLFNLYKTWSEGGVGLILTGNVMIAPDALTGPGGVVLEDDSNLSAFKQWAQAGRQGGAQFWMQINHPGRQVYASMGETAYAPSAIALDMGQYSSMFAQPQALTEDEIQTIIQRFANTASLAEQAGFTGVQIHAAHGYLLSQFLSPLVNQRQDQWGGAIENRARLLLSVIQAVRSSVSTDFCVSVKMNSADFQKGGFDIDDAKWVVEQMNSLGVQLVELSGGSYESPAMQGNVADDASSTLQREAYFIEFARDIAQVASMPLMVTGGILKRAVAESALQQDDAGFGVKMLGIGRAMAFHPDLPNKWRDAEFEVSLPEITWKNQVMSALAVMSVTKLQLGRMAQGKAIKANANPLLTLLADRFKTSLRTKRYRKWRNQKAA